MLDSLRADAKFLGDSLLRISSDDKHDDLPFAWGKTKVLPACSDSRLFLMRHRAPPLARRIHSASSMQNAVGNGTDRSRSTLGGCLTVGILLRAGHSFHTQLLANRTSVHLPSPRKPVMLYGHSKGWRTTPNVTLLRTYHYTLTKNLARSLILDYHRKREPHLDRSLWAQDTFGSKQNSGAADIFRLPFEPYPAAGFAIADRHANWETLGAIRNFRCPFRHWVEAHSICETGNLFRLPALLPPIGCPIQGIPSPTRGNTHLSSPARLPGILHAIVQKARCQVKKNRPQSPI